MRRSNWDGEGLQKPTRSSWNTWPGSCLGDVSTAFRRPISVMRGKMSGQGSEWDEVFQHWGSSKCVASFLSVILSAYTDSAVIYSGDRIQHPHQRHSRADCFTHSIGWDLGEKPTSAGGDGRHKTTAQAQILTIGQAHWLPSLVLSLCCLF
jgi:hypothetical protein